MAEPAGLPPPSEGSRPSGLDAEGWEALVRQYQHQIYRFVKRMVHEEVMAEDVTQQVFLEALRSWARFEGRSSVRVWLYRIAAHQTAKYLRDHVSKAKRTRSLEAPRVNAAGDEWVEEIPDWTMNPEARLMREEEGRLVEEALQALPGEYRATLWLRVMEGMSYEEIAGAVGCSVGTVRSRIHNGKVRIAQWLKVRL